MAKSYKKEMAKYQAKQFFNGESKRFWVAGLAPLFLLTAGPITENDTVDSYAPDIEQIDVTMTENAANAVLDYIAAKQKVDELDRAVYNDRYDGNVSVDLERQHNLAEKDAMWKGRMVYNYMFDDPRMTEHQFKDYDWLMDQFDASVVPDNVEPYALNECRIKYEDTDRDGHGDGLRSTTQSVERCMTLENNFDWEEVLTKTLGGAFLSLLWMLALLIPGESFLKQGPKPNRKDFKPKGN